MNCTTAYRCILVAIFLLATGCGDKGVKTIPVKGKITRDGGGWGRPGLIYFTAAEPAEGFPRRPGMADFDTDGNFVAETFNPGDGLIPGRYVVNLECWEVPPTMGGPPAKSYIPEKFKHGSTSGFEVIVEADQRGPVVVNFDVKTID
jgi:hypothetical protein